MRPPDKKSEPGSPEDWLAHAESDLNLARLAKNREEILPEQVCFHAQQAAEKALKAVLLARGIAFPFVHDIDELLEVAAQGGLALPSELMDAGSLTAYAVEARYPGHWAAISPSEVEDAIGQAEAIFAWAAAAIERHGED
jgi:HEPN domain-containing protein